MKKSITLIIASSVFVGALGGCSTGSDVEKSEMGQDELVVNDLANDRVYINEKFKFSLENLDGLIIEENEQSPSEYSPMVSQIRFEDADSKVLFSINVYNKTFTSFENFESWHDKNLLSTRPATIDKVKIGKYEAIKTTEPDGIESVGIYIYLRHGEYTLSFRCDNNPDDEATLLRYLATFEFEE